MPDVILKSLPEDRKKEVVDACLNVFSKQGLSETSVRDLSKSIHLQSAGMYSYFPTKNEAVVACAEEAAMRLEKNLIMYAIKEIGADPDQLIDRLFERAEKNAPSMRFLSQVYTTPKYSKQLDPVFEKLYSRYEYYSKRCAEKLGLTKDVFTPYFLIGISAFQSYMLFKNKDSVMPQIELIKDFLFDIRSKSNELEVGLYDGE